MVALPLSLSVSRRKFLTNSGWLAAGATVLTACSGVIPVLPTTGDPDKDDALAWFQLLPDGRLRFYCPRMEMGQGATLGLTQIVAEEMNLPQSRIECVIPDSSQVPAFKMTVGSESLALFSDPVSFGAANLREFLRTQAAQQYDVDQAQVSDARSGFDIAGDFITYQSLITGKNQVLFARTEDFEAQDVPQYFHRREHSAQAVGKSWPSPELNAIVTGQTLYSRDIHLPDMLYGEVVRPPWFGAKLLSVSEEEASALPGVKRIVHDKDRNFLGILCDNPFALQAATDRLTATWSAPEAAKPADHLDVVPHQVANDFEHTLLDKEATSGASAPASQSLNRRYSTPYMAHAAMEPRAAVAWVQKTGVEIWCGCQDPFFVRDRVAALLRRDKETVQVHPLRMGGGFGGRVLCQPAEEAALLSAEVGRPVRVDWSRETEFQHNYFQPRFSHAIQAKLTKDGQIQQWRHDFVSAPIIFGLAPKSLAGILDSFMADKGTARGAVIPYTVGKQRIRYSDLRSDVPTGAWRGLGAAPNTFAIESMMDELALLAGKDPLAFRLQHLSETDGTKGRLAAVVSRVGQLSGWGRPLEKGQGLGVACAIYKEQTPVAVVARVNLDEQRQDIRVDRLWCVQDSGRVINPDQVKNQVEGNLIWGCSMALKEQLTFSNGQAEQVNFDSYQLLRHSEAPRIEVELMQRPEAPPSGVGESAFAPSVAAIANAVSAASGVRQRHLPLQAEKLYL
ncbi:molybdopterin cofactor-binding domain-containing protein [Rhodovibrionaceae bacterium A322]